MKSKNIHDPKEVSFIVKDTCRGNYNDPLSLNLYTYCHNNPLIYQDPTGHSVQYLKYGTKGDEVKQLQTWLIDCGYPIQIDGIFGSETQKAVKQFQEYNGLYADGVVGNQTWSVLERRVVLNVAGNNTSGLSTSVIEGEMNNAKQAASWTVII